MRTYWNINLEFKPQDLWVGAYWNRREFGRWVSGKPDYRLDIWICLVPMLPIHITIGRNVAGFVN